MTKAKTDVKQTTLKEVTTRVYTLMKEYVAVSESPLWKLSDEARYMYVSLAYKRNIISEIFKEQYERAIGIKREWMDSKNYKRFQNQLHRINQAVFLATLPGNSYDDYRNSGRSFTACWMEANGFFHKSKQKKLTNIAEGKESTEHMRQRLEKEAAEGVANADVLAEAVVAGPKTVNKLSEIPDKKNSSWTAKPVDTDKEWVSTGWKIVRDDPKTFVKLVEICVNKLLLSEKVLTLVKEELMKS